MSQDPPRNIYDVQARQQSLTDSYSFPTHSDLRAENRYMEPEASGAEEREKEMQQQVDDIVARARKEAEEIMERERAARSTSPALDNQQWGHWPKDSFNTPSGRSETITTGEEAQLQKPLPPTPNLENFAPPLEPLEHPLPPIADMWEYPVIPQHLGPPPGYDPRSVPSYYTSLPEGSYYF
ncbi:hypothetical protein QBC38DRAFT_459452 [Podospora fimiseda]|uniref:Uncharacterized protein n=1 Tax=Podospora fimiseda TaxID=252190 RepID=A0AAN7BHE7_9PEZI|nr:hypothetical protein QBC38DRAFT_459452 [Podospora fimiseda]